MAQRRRKKPQPRSSGAGALVLVFGTLILFSLLVRLLIGLLGGAPVPEQPETEPPAQTEAAAVPEQPQQKQSLWDRLFGRKDPEPTVPEEPGTTPPETEPTLVSTATVGAMGDMLMHMQLFSDKVNAISNLGNGSYDFSPVFEYMTDTLGTLDYAIANLETTFGGDGFPYQGNPAFNCPDQLADALARAGYDMMLTANNHCADTLAEGITRTLEVVRDAGMQTLGTRLSDQEQRYEVVQVNGISIGMTCYTYTLSMSEGKPSLNGGAPLQRDELVNYFSYNDLEGFYSQLSGVYSDMLADGAEATMIFIHWGDEYQLTQNHHQDAIAQRLCDMGFDVIVGGHPHVVQPMELLRSTRDPDHSTVCIYSLGNSVSNQRLGNLDAIDTAHTEDGVLFTVTFEKYSDGTVYLSETDVLPLWVTMHDRTGKLEYNILPLDISLQDSWQERFELGSYSFKSAQESRKRTMEILGEGLLECRNHLTQAAQLRQQAQSAETAQ